MRRCSIRLYPLGLLCASIAASAACPEADSQALAWLDKMSRSMQEVNYQGVVTLQRSNEMQVVQVAHSVDNGISSERLTQLTGQGAQVDREAHPLSCEHPGHRLLRVRDQIQSGDCGIAAQYRFHVADGERVAGRKSVRIGIEPRDMYRYGYRMALDRETGVLLKAEILGRGSRTLERFQFANLSYHTPADDVAQVNVEHTAAHPHPHASVTYARVSRPWQTGWVPNGFLPTDGSSGYDGRRSFTDGLAVFSVFVEEFERGLRPGEGLVQRGSTITYTRGMALAGAPVLVTVIGEIPVNTARMVADSVAWVQ